MHAWRSITVLALLAGALAGCEGVTTGTEVARMPLQAAGDGASGAYMPVKLSLGPEMNPVAINFRADFSQNAAEFGKWNTYRVVLSGNNGVAASRNININHPQTQADGASPPPANTIHTLLIVDVPSSGEYELTITPVQPVAIALTNAQVDVRRNVQRRQ
jgi:hypothetical protein